MKHAPLARKTFRRSYTDSPGVAEAAQRWASMEKTNEPLDQNMVQYQHPRQEQLLRHSAGYGIGPIGSDNPNSANHAPMVNEMAYGYQHEIQQDPSIHTHGGQGNEWLAQGQIGYNQQEAMPNVTQGPSEGTRGIQYLWH